STKAVKKGSRIDKVKKHANWSLNTSTFEDYYYKPVGQLNESTKIQNAIFSNDTENITTTSESEAEATRIVIGMTANPQVAEAKDEEVVVTRPC
ncbi:hypothetical protein A0J61_08792, partial [Choanephora cucurbitarum]